MFDKTKAKLKAEYVEPVTRSVTAAILMAATALIFGFLAFVRSL